MAPGSAPPWPGSSTTTGSRAPAGHGSAAALRLPIVVGSAANLRRSRGWHRRHAAADGGTAAGAGWTRPRWPLVRRPPCRRRADSAGCPSMAAAGWRRRCGTAVPCRPRTAPARPFRHRIGGRAPARAAYPQPSRAAIAPPPDRSPADRGRSARARQRRRRGRDRARRGCAARSRRSAARRTAGVRSRLGQRRCSDQTAAS